MKISEFQAMIDKVYGAKDRDRGASATFQWFTEEVGELARAMRKGDSENMKEEFADVLAWLSTLASICKIDLEEAALAKYPGKCSKCGNIPCSCPESFNPGL